MSYRSLHRNDSHEAIHHEDEDEDELESMKPDQSKGAVLSMGDEEWQSAVYRKLYAVLTIMTVVLVCINILQVALLPMMTNMYWVVLFPLVFFSFFIAWALAIIFSNPLAFRTENGNAIAGIRNALRHLRSLLSLRVYPVVEEKMANRPNKDWPKRFTRAGILITILFNVILTEFIYLPLFAVPEFRKKIWNVSLNYTDPPPAPAVVVFQNLNKTFSNRAVLPEDNQVWLDLCNGVESWGIPFQSCVANQTEYFEGPARSAIVEETVIRYAVFHPEEPFQALPLFVGFEMFYPHWFNSSAYGDIVTSVVFLDPALADDFPTAYQCAISSLILLGTFQSQQVNLRPFTIIDEINASGRTGMCDIEAFQRYQGYELSEAEWGVRPNTPYLCDIAHADQADVAPCNGSFQIVFPTGANTVYHSAHGKTWITILTEEGGVVGFVTFLTWFFGIFEM